MITLPSLHATIQSHTVRRDDGKLTAGYLVRDSATRREMGHVCWIPATATTADRWFWRTPDDRHFGDRVSRHAAILVLREAFDLAHDVQRARSAAPYVYDDTTTTTTRTVTATRATAARVTTTTPRAAAARVQQQQIVWTTTSSSPTAAIAAAFKKETR